MIPFNIMYGIWQAVWLGESGSSSWKKLRFEYLSCRYDAFDFHQECSRMRWHRLSILLDKLTQKQEEFGCVSLRLLSSSL